MRGLTNAAKVEELMRELGRRATGPGRVYFAGGATAVLIGWRDATKDVDLDLAPEPAGVFEAIRAIKDVLAINIELATPAHFLPPVPGWEQRSIYIATHGQVEFYHCDPLSQALSKISRGHTQDLNDVSQMHARGLFTADDLVKGCAQILPQVIRYPNLDADVLRQKVNEMASTLREERR